VCAAAAPTDWLYARPPHGLAEQRQPLGETDELGETSRAGLNPARLDLGYGSVPQPQILGDDALSAGLVEAPLTLPTFVGVPVELGAVQRERLDRQLATAPVARLLRALGDRCSLPGRIFAVEVEG
jgi:hypothetical protein